MKQVEVHADLLKQLSVELIELVFSHIVEETRENIDIYAFGYFDGAYSADFLIGYKGDYYNTKQVKEKKLMDSEDIYFVLDNMIEKIHNIEKQFSKDSVDFPTLIKAIYYEGGKFSAEYDYNKYDVGEYTLFEQWVHEIKTGESQNIIVENQESNLEFTELEKEMIVRGKEEVYKKNQEMKAKYNIFSGGVYWEADQEEGKVYFSTNEGVRYEADLQIIGTYDSEHLTFMWSNKNQSLRDNVKSLAKVVCESNRRVSLFQEDIISCVPSEVENLIYLFASTGFQFDGEFNNGNIYFVYQNLSKTNE